MGDEGDIQFAAPHLFRQVDGRFADDVKLDVRMRLGETTDDLRHVAVGIIVGRADPERAFQPVIVEGGDRLVVQADDPAGVIQQFFALRRHADAAAVLGEELLADTLLQSAHLHRYGGLRLEHPVGRPGEAAGIDDGDEGLQLIDIERRGHGVIHKID